MTYWLNVIINNQEVKKPRNKKVKKSGIQREWRDITYGNGRKRIGEIDHA